MGSSTRMELAAWLLSMTRNKAVYMATDSKAMLDKAAKLMNAAELRTLTKEEDWWILPNPFKKPWGLQADGDLWRMGWMAVLARGVGRQTLKKVKGHATARQVEEGVAAEDEKEGNDWADSFADRGAV